MHFYKCILIYNIFFLNFYSKAFLMGGSGNLDKLAWSALIVPRSGLGAVSKGKEKIQEGLA